MQTRNTTRSSRILKQTTLIELQHLDGDVVRRDLDDRNITRRRSDFGLLGQKR